MGHGSSTLCAHVETKDQKGKVKVNTSTTKSSKPTQDTKADTEENFEDMSKQAVHRKEDISEGSQQAEDRRTSQGIDLTGYGETNQQAQNVHDKMDPIDNFYSEQLSEVCISESPRKNSKPQSHSYQHDRNHGHDSDRDKQMYTQPITANFVEDRVGVDDDEPNLSVEQFDESPVESPNSLAGKSSSKEENSCNSMRTSPGDITYESRQTTCVKHGPHETEIHSIGTYIPDIPTASVDLYSLKNVVYSPIKLPDVNEVTSSVSTALTTRSLLSGYKVITVGSKDEQGGNFSETDESNMPPKPSPETHKTSAILINQYSERYKTFTDASVLVLSGEPDADVSMYGCAEGSNDESMYLLAEMADPASFSGDDDSPPHTLKTILSKVNSNPTASPLSQNDLKKRRKSVWIKTAALTRVLKLPVARRANSLPLAQHESDNTKMSAWNNMIHFSTQAMKRYSNKKMDCFESEKIEKDMTNAIRTQVEKSNWYSDTSLTAGDSTMAEQKYLVDTINNLENFAKTQLELETKEEMNGGITDEPHGIELSWEAQIHTPSILESPPAQVDQMNEYRTEISRNKSVAIADSELYSTHRSSDESIQNAHYNGPHVRQNGEIARRRLQSLPSQKDLVRSPAVEIYASQLIGSQSCNIFRQLDRRSIGVPHSLQSLQLADDLGVLVEEEQQLPLNINVENNNGKEKADHNFISSSLWTRRYLSRLCSTSAGTNGNNCLYANSDIPIHWDGKEDNSEACIQSSSEMIFVDSPTCLDCLPIRMNS
ncbi:uncharacterized protein DEA37_0006893 [Paragonimus westermani]|uniref:Uncharacterized protein n=1 Tax=Paragonimus westermani TaxID=34504 RepID=A0A5J4NME1_9TREM|nr:uncharacterized protein DEA37_0006893 [Paragonimus westermani]